MTPTAPVTTDGPIQTINNTVNGFNENKRIKVSGGWNLSTQTQDGWTNFYNSGNRYRGQAIYHLACVSDSVTTNYVEISKFRMIRYNVGLYIRNSLMTDYKNITTLECNYGFHTAARYSPQNCYFLNCIAIGGYTYGWYFNVWGGGCFFENMVATGYTSQGVYVANSNNNSVLSSCTFKSCRFVLNRSINFYDYAYSYNYTQWIDCEFNDSLLSTGYYQTSDGGRTYPNFVNCQFNRNCGDGGYWSSVTVFFVGCQFNNNLSKGCNMYQCTPFMEGCVANNNVMEGIYNNVNSALREWHFKHIRAFNNQCGRDIFFTNGVYSPINSTYPDKHLPTKRHEEQYLTWSAEDVKAGNWRFDFTAGHGPAYANMAQYGTDWRWTLYGIVGKYTGSEARGGSGTCMYIQPQGRFTSYYDQPMFSARFKEFQGATQGEIQFRYEGTNNKVLKVWMKKTSDLVMGTIKFAVVANSGKVYYSDNLNLTSDYQQFSLPINAADFTTDGYYSLRILVSPKNEVWNIGKVYVDDFSIEDA
jgi:hypothetical protein